MHRSLILASILASVSIDPARAQVFYGLGIPGAGLGDDGAPLRGVLQAPSLAVFRWTPSTGWVQIGGGTTTIDQGGPVSGNGLVYVGNGPSPDGEHAMRWTSGTGITIDLGALPGSTGSNVSGVNSDGSVVVGNSRVNGSLVAFRWTSGTGMQSLGTLGSGHSSSASAVSGDGLVVTGTDSYSGPPCSTISNVFRWEGGSMQNLGRLPGDIIATGDAVNFDGSVIVGHSTTCGPLVDHGFRWVSGVGMTNIGNLAGYQNLGGINVSADGSTIAGYSFSFDSPFLPQVAVMWTSALGWVDLNVYLPSLGIDLTGWVLLAAGTSGDGLTIVGSGRHNGVGEAWFADLHTTCYPNCDASTVPPVLNINDFTCFLNKFAAGNPYANCDGSTTTPLLNINDFVCFLNRFAAGCP